MPRSNIHSRGPSPRGRESHPKIARLSGVADSLGIKEHLLYRWIRELRAQGAKAFPGNGVVSRDEELFRLQRDLKRVTEERDFLKKTVAFFAREHR